MKKLFFALFFLFFFISCEKVTSLFESEKTSTFLFLYTNDEHGHIYEKGGWYKGSALYEMWEEEEENCKGCEIFKISGGDNYTGTAISSFFNGESTAEIISLIGYKISALGNHEFDFGTSSFEENRKISKLDYLSSNIISSDLKPAFKPSLIYPAVNGKISFVASMTEELKQISFANYFKDLVVVKPASTVGRELKKNESLSDFQVLIVHESADIAKEWIATLPVKPLVVFGGHDHKQFMESDFGILFIQTEGYLKSYARVEVEKKGTTFRVVKAEIIPLKEKAHFSSETSMKIKNTVDSYLAKLDKKAGLKLITAAKNTDSKQFQKLYACSTLNAYPEHDVAMSNAGAFRDVLVSGVIKKSDIISILPFQNRIVLSTIKGKDLVYNLNLSKECYCGAVKKGEEWFVRGEKVEKDKKYSAVIHEYIYQGGDYYKFIFEDSENIITSRDWRDPLEKYLIESSAKGLKLEQAYKELMLKFNR
ncbi:MAG: 5'-nucleotidase C-terminal domain-containing protein [bacterium]